MTITGHARLAGVMGWPVGHSLSPRLHNRWLEIHGIDGAYVPLPVAPEHFSQALRMIGLLGFRGVNVTVPHKEAALRAVDEADAIARRIGAVNTVIVRDDGSLFGTNTDSSGFMAHLRASVPRFDASRAPAVILGAGGAARAIAVGLLDAGVPEIRLVNRSLDRAESLALALGSKVRVANWVNRGQTLKGSGLVVNTTSLGMVGQPPLSLSLDALDETVPVFDVVYNPLVTDLLRHAAERGNPAIGGLGMLLHQAVPGFESWFGVRPEVDAGLETYVAAGLS